MASLKSDRRLYLDPDRERVVEHGDPGSAWLLAAEGSVIGPDEVARYGLRMRDGKVVIPDAEPEEKMAEPPEDKMVATPENKAAEPVEEPDEEYPRHVGGGWYELPDGERVQGREAAEAAMAGD